MWCWLWPRCYDASINVMLEGGGPLAHVGHWTWNVFVGPNSNTPHMPRVLPSPLPPQAYIDRCRIHCSSTKIDKGYCTYFLYVFLPNLQTTTLSVYCSLLKSLIWLPWEQQRSLISTFDIKRGSHSLGFVFVGFIHPLCPENYTQVCFDWFKIKLLSWGLHISMFWTVEN